MKPWFATPFMTSGQETERAPFFTTLERAQAFTVINLVRLRL